MDGVIKYWLSEELRMCVICKKELGSMEHILFKCVDRVVVEEIRGGEAGTAEHVVCNLLSDKVKKESYEIIKRLGKKTRLC